MGHTGLGGVIVNAGVGVVFVSLTAVFRRQIRPEYCLFRNTSALTHSELYATKFKEEIKVLRTSLFLPVQLLLFP